MRCPLCGDPGAVAMLTSVECPARGCSNNATALGSPSPGVFPWALAEHPGGDRECYENVDCREEHVGSAVWLSRLQVSVCKPKNLWAVQVRLVGLAIEPWLA